MLKSPSRRFKRLPFYHTCVDWPRPDVHTDDGLIAMIDQARDIGREAFLQHVNLDELRSLERDLGYTRYAPSPGFTMAADWAVSYHRSKLHGKTVYYFRHSAIEYVFAEQEKKTCLK